jgi:tRNA dimethylallyltransferase
MRSSAALADGKLRVICGPTGGGKSALAMALAEEFPLTILSADSRQIYRGFDIGTAKPTLAEQALVPHRGINVVDPIERYSAARWAADALEWIAESKHGGRTPVVVGGTGFYIRALTEPLFEEPPLDPQRRLELQAQLAPLSLSELRRWCEQLDPARAHLGHAQLLRAIEVALLTGVPISVWHARTRREPLVQARYLLLVPGSVLHQQIAYRVNSMFESGWEEEVVTLEARVPDSAPAWNATGYLAVRELVQGKITRAAAVDRIVIDTRQYAKRQRTWFRHQLDANSVTMIDPTQPDARERARAWWLEA